MTEKIALITGANKGIGFEIAKGLGRKGVTVLLGARSAERGEAAAATLQDQGIDAAHVLLDVTDTDTVTSAAGFIEQNYGRLDILVNNAGIALADGAWNTSELTMATMRAVYETNVFGVVAVTNAMIPLLREAAAARIVNVSSEIGSIAVALQRDSPFWSLQGGAYGSSKTALNMLTVSYAKEFWDTPVKVNAVSPGYTATDLNGHKGHRTPQAGAAIAIEMALLDESGPTGSFRSDEELFLTPEGVLPW